MKIVKGIIIAAIIYLVASTGILSDNPDVMDAALKLPQLGRWLAAGILLAVLFRLSTGIESESSDGQPGGVRPRGHR